MAYNYEGEFASSGPTTDGEMYTCTGRRHEEGAHLMCKEGYHSFEEFMEWAEAQEMDGADEAEADAKADADGFLMKAGESDDDGMFEDALDWDIVQLSETEKIQFDQMRKAQRFSDWAIPLVPLEAELFQRDPIIMIDVWN